LSDSQIRALVERNAVIGAAFDMWMLIPEWHPGHATNHAVSMATVAEHIDHVCQGFGRESSPHDLDTIADVQHLAEALSERDFDDDDIANVMYNNWLRLLRRSWERAEQ
jgi:membrane dipeptidase